MALAPEVSPVCRTCNTKRRAWSEKALLCSCRDYLWKVLTDITENCGHILFVRCVRLTRSNGDGWIVVCWGPGEWADAGATGACVGPKMAMLWNIVSQWLIYMLYKYYWSCVLPFRKCVLLWDFLSCSFLSELFQTVLFIIFMSLFVSLQLTPLVCVYSPVLRNWCR